MHIDLADEASQTRLDHSGRILMNPLLSLNQRGQFVWLDHISRNLITGGGLQRLISEDGLGGVTSNPTIFDKAIAESTDYDATLRRALDADRDISDRALAERLTVEDIQLAADVLRPVYRPRRSMRFAITDVFGSPSEPDPHDGELT
jgi:transaldolase/fructose-6-phosphate aldolase-like protein